MARPGDNPQHHLEEQMERRDLHVVRDPDTGASRRPRAVRRRPAWVLLALSLAMLITGMVLPHGLLLRPAWSRREWRRICSHLRGIAPSPAPACPDTHRHTHSDSGLQTITSA